MDPAMKSAITPLKNRIEIKPAAVTIRARKEPAQVFLFPRIVKNFSGAEKVRGFDEESE